MAGCLTIFNERLIGQPDFLEERGDDLVTLLILFRDCETLFGRLCLTKENIDQLIDAMKEPSHAALDIPDVRNKLAESRRLLEHAARIDAITPRTLLG